MSAVPIVALLAFGCTTDDLGLAGPAVEPDPTVFNAEVEPGPAALRKLTRTQYVNSVKDLLGAEVSVPPTAEPDATSGGLASVGASTTTYSPRGIESFEQTAFAIAEAAMGDAAVAGRLVTCTPAGTVDAACAQTVLARLARRAWRRPVTDEEVAGVVAVAGEAAETLGTFEEGLQYGLAAILQSPNFLYRTEIGRTTADGLVFDDYELATRLSFFLWNTTPDDALLDAAERGELSTEIGLLAQAQRLMASDRVRTGMRRFFVEYLQLEDLETLSKDPTVFEFFNNELGPAAMEETLRLVDWMVFDDDSDFRTLMTTTTTFVNPLLAALYGIPTPIQTDDFVQVRLPADGPRVGLLGKAAFLNAHAHAVSSSVTLRGKAVRNILLCQNLPSPPVNVDTSIPEPSGTAPTMRERVAEHLQEPTCAGCHVLMDPIGLALENFDGTGRFRLLDNGAMIDPSGDLDGETFDGPRGLGLAVAQHPAFSACVTRTMARYAIGRAESSNERAHLNTLNARFAASGYRVKSLMLEIIRSPLFRLAGVGAER
ncbi:MAG: hypothetical protein ACI9OJ_001192 [Myxococcota bacterium]|jgi:hypothetical protein